MDREENPNGRFLKPRRIFKVSAVKINGEWCPVIDGKTYEGLGSWDKKKFCIEWTQKFAEHIVKIATD